MYIYGGRAPASAARVCSRYSCLIPGPLQLSQCSAASALSSWATLASSLVVANALLMKCIACSVLSSAGLNNCGVSVDRERHCYRRPVRPDDAVLDKQTEPLQFSSSSAPSAAPEAPSSACSPPTPPWRKPFSLDDEAAHRSVRSSHCIPMSFCT